MTDAPAEHPDELPDLPQWAIALLQSTASPAPEPTVGPITAQQNQPVWPLLADAAVVGAFLPKSLAPQAVDTAVRQSAERALLGFSETTHTPDGVKWILQRDARVAVLNALGTGDDLKQAIERTKTNPEFADPFSAALRRCLETPSAVKASDDDLDALEATRTAVAAIAGVRAVTTLPQLDDLDRKVEFARLLAQFGRMVGEVPGHPGSDRFYGRTAELKALRDYCDSVEPASIREQFTRLTNRVARSFAIVPRIVWGVGGVGKTTLVAKFMLQQARAGRSKFPFAYLDFDRSTVNAAHPTPLLAEICNQVATQFAELSEPLGKLRTQLRELASKTETLSPSEVISQLRPYIHEFRGYVDRLLEGYEKTFETARPFVLVFDTFEVVQYEADLVRHLEQFVAAFNDPNSSRPWVRLRLIIAGRRQVTTFLSTVVDVSLGPLDPTGSADMLKALAVRAGVSLSQTDADAVVTSIAKQVSGKTRGGVHPLQLQLVGTIIDQMKKEADLAHRPFSIQTLLSELGQSNATGLAGRIFVNGILVRRILGHVVDPRVKALADPGLVVRRITEGVILHVMAPSTNPPRLDGTVDDGDEDVATPWQLTGDEARDIYNAFSREVTLVEHDDDALRHRPDVRQEMLPLIKARRPRRFATMHKRAFDYFSGLLLKEPDDDKSAAEAIYHGLWLNEPDQPLARRLEQLNAWWRPDDHFTPRIDPDEFETGTLANVFVRAKALSELSSDEVWQLPRAVTLDWLTGRSEALLQVERVNLETMSVIRSAVGQDFEDLHDRPALAATVARMLYRGGEWQDAMRLLSRTLDTPMVWSLLASAPSSTTGHQRDYWSLLRTYASILAKSGRNTEALERHNDVMLGAPDPLTRVEFVLHRALGEARLTRSRFARPRWQMELVDRLGRVPAEQWRQHGARILRLAILLLGDRGHDITVQYARTLERLPRDRELGAAVRAVLEPLVGPDRSDLIRRLGGKKPIDAETFEEIDAAWRASGAEGFGSLDSTRRAAFIRLLAEDHREWVRPLGNAMTRELLGNFGLELRAWLKRFDFGYGPTGSDDDGLSYVQTAYDAGRFRELATGLQSLGDRKQASLSGGEYPRDVFELASTFRECRAAVLEAFVGEDAAGGEGVR